MKFDPRIHHRASTRMRGYDYSLAGTYSITIVTYQRPIFFGEVVAGTSPQGDHVKLNSRGKIVQEAWFRSAEIRKEIRLFPEEFVVMPNHIPGIVWIVDSQILAANNVGADGQVKPPLQNDAEKKKQTPTNLYNTRPTCLDLAHKRLDESVFVAYGWKSDLIDEEILAKLLALNLERAKKE